MIGVELLHAAELRGVQKRAPVDARRLLLELLARPDLRAVGEILALLARLVRLGDLGLEVHDPPRRALRIGIAGVLQDRLRRRPGTCCAMSAILASPER